MSSVGLDRKAGTVVEVGAGRRARLEEARARPRWAWLRDLTRNPLTLSGMVVVAGLVVAALFAPLLAPGDPTGFALTQRFEPPGRVFLLGTDDYGRDILSRLMWGARTSLQIGLVVVLVAGSVGFLLGSLSGFVRGPFDHVLMRVMDVVLAFPPLVLALAVASFLGPDLRNAMIAIAIVYLPKYVRLARGEALALRESLFVLAARSSGVPPARIVLRHVMPNSLAPMLVVATLDLGQVILVAASLGFLGLGAQPPTPEWGAMVADGQKYLLESPWLATFPGLTIVLAVVAFSVFGDGLRDVLDPRLRH